MLQRRRVVYCVWHLIPLSAQAFVTVAHVLAATPTPNGDIDECFSTLNPIFSTLLSHSYFYKPPSANYCTFFYKISRYIEYFFKPFLFLLTFQLPPAPKVPKDSDTVAPRYESIV